MIRAESRGPRVITWLLLAVPVCAVLGIVLGAGSPPPGVSAVTYTTAIVLATLGWYGSVLILPLMLVVSAICLGAMIKQALANRMVRLAPGVAPALGLGALLSVIHGVWWLAGFVGGLHGFVATVMAWAIVLGPVIVWQRRFRLPTWIFAGGILVEGLPGSSAKDAAAGRARWREGVVLLLVIVAALGFVMPYAMVAPGTLWRSEYGGYDALSYHLPLAQEWYTRGWLAPVAHNVYSFLPSYFESAFVHMAAMVGSPQNAAARLGAPGQVAVGLMAGDGRLVLSAQALHTLTLGFAAWSVAGLARGIWMRVRFDRGEPDDEADDAGNAAGKDVAGFGARCAGLIAAILTIASPWMVVTGTLAYNEAPLVAMLAAALACALSAELGAKSRGVLCGVLTGLACCIKPSALVLGAPMVGIAMLVGCWDAVRAAHYPNFRYVVTRRVGMCVGVCLVAGAVTLSPWLIRNAIAAGNPVFPFAAGVLGHGHWNKEQAARYGAAHKPDRGVMGALALLVAPDPRVASDAPAVQRYRGASNPQWMPLMPMGAVGLIVLVAMPRTRRAGLVLVGGAAAVALGWAAMTHAQSRFLVVLVPIAAASAGLAIGVVVARVRDASRQRIVGNIAIAGVVGVSALVWFVVGPIAQAAGSADQNAALEATLFGGPSVHTAVEVARQIDAASGDEQRQGVFLESASPTSYVALLPGVDLRRVLLIGDATPLYAGPVAYSTTWDTWPILEAMRQSPDEPKQWTRDLKARGFDYAIVSMSEVARLAASGYVDPAITPERIGEWMRSGTRLVRAWPDRATYLVELRVPEREPVGKPAESPRWQGGVP